VEIKSTWNDFAT